MKKYQETALRMSIPISNIHRCLFQWLVITKTGTHTFCPIVCKSQYITSLVNPTAKSHERILILNLVKYLKDRVDKQKGFEMTGRYTTSPCIQLDVPWQPSLPTDYELIKLSKTEYIIILLLLAESQFKSCSSY